MGTVFETLNNFKDSKIKEMSDNDKQIIGNVLVDSDNILRKNYVTAESGCEFARGFTIDEVLAWDLDYKKKVREYHIAAEFTYP